MYYILQIFRAGPKYSNLTENINDTMMKILQKIDSLITLKLGISFILSLGSCVFKYGYGFVVNLGHVKFL